MADPVSITAGAIGLLDTGLGTCKLLLDFYRATRNSRRDVSDTCEAMERLQGQLDAVKAAIERCNAEDNSTMAVSRSLEACKLPIARLASKAEKIRKRSDEGGVKRLAGSVQYAFRETTLNKMRDIVTRDLTESLLVSMNLLNINTTNLGFRTINEAQQQANTEITALRQEHSTAFHSLAKVFEQDRNAKTKEDLIDWLGRANHSTEYHRSAYEQRGKDTCSWFINSAEYLAWRDSPNSMLWVHGKPGCGKTVICSTIIEDVSSFCTDKDGYKVAYFYFSFRDFSRQKITTFLHAILVQLLQQTSTLSRRLEDWYKQHERVQLSSDDLVAAFKLLMEDAQNVYLIADGLDECAIPGEQYRLVTLFKTMIDFNLKELHVLVTSRKRQELEGLKDINSLKAVGIQNQSTDDDIFSHVSKELEADPVMRNWPSDIKNEIQTVVGHGADGMFRWATCQLDSLRTCLRPSSVRLKLKSLPKTLEKTYEQTLLAIDPDYESEAISALHWLVNAQRPLSVGELGEAVIINPSKSDAFDVNDRFFDSFSLPNLLSGLISTNESNRVQFAHFSVKEFLTSNLIANGPAARFHVPSKASHKHLAESCIDYLRVMEEKKYVDAISPRLRLGFTFEFRMFEYACKHWQDHLIMATDEGHFQDLHRKGADFLTHWEFWINYYDPETGSSRSPYPLPSYRMLKRYGNRSLPRIAPASGIAYQKENISEKHNYDRIREIFYNNNDWGLLYSVFQEREPSARRTPLYQAACLGLEGVVRTLIEGGEEINEWGGTFGTPLQIAAIKGHIGVMEMLLAQGALVNTAVGRFGNALQAACFHGQETAVTRLLSAGAHVNWPGAFDTALDVIPYTKLRNIPIVMALLTSQSSLEKANNAVGWILKWASLGGYEEVVQAIVSRMPWKKGEIDFRFSSKAGLRPDADCPDGVFGARSHPRNGSAPHEAVFMGYEKIAELLIPFWNNPDEVGWSKRSALYWACVFDRPNMVRLLLTAGANVRESEALSTGWTPYYWAVFNGNIEIQKLLRSARKKQTGSLKRSSNGVTKRTTNPMLSSNTRSRGV